MWAAWWLRKKWKLICYVSIHTEDARCCSFFYSCTAPVYTLVTLTSNPYSGTAMYGGIIYEENKSGLYGLLGWLCS